MYRVTLKALALLLCLALMAGCYTSKTLYLSNYRAVPVDRFFGSGTNGFFSYEKKALFLVRGSGTGGTLSIIGSKPDNDTFRQILSVREIPSLGPDHYIMVARSDGGFAYYPFEATDTGIRLAQSTGEVISEPQLILRAAADFRNGNAVLFTRVRPNELPTLTDAFRTTRQN